MKILITGGNGYLARNLNRLLTSKGHVIYSPSRMELDMLKLDDVKKTFHTFKPDATIHCAIKGGMRGEKDTFENVYVPNIEMFENLMKAGSNQDPIIFFGSGAEFDR